MRIAITLIFICWSPANFANASVEFAESGAIAWAAFECSALASEANEEVEQKRLFNLGYAKGKEFIEAVKAKKVEQSDLSARVPLILLMLLQGPSPDFMLGRAFESALEDSLEEVYAADDGVFPDEELRRVRASNKFESSNCRLLGK